MRISIIAVSLLLAACSSGARNAGPSSETVRLKLPPDQAAACFARNAEEHSGALVAEVSPGRDRAEVVVRVRNGVVYAMADFARAGAGSTARLTLNVTSRGRRSDLVDALLEGC
jgi:hypothetical protein